MIICCFEFYTFSVENNCLQVFNNEHQKVYKNLIESLSLNNFFDINSGILKTRKGIKSVLILDSESRGIFRRKLEELIQQKSDQSLDCLIAKFILTELDIFEWRSDELYKRISELLEIGILPSLPELCSWRETLFQEAVKYFIKIGNYDYARKLIALQIKKFPDSSIQKDVEEQLQRLNVSPTQYSLSLIDSTDINKEYSRLIYYDTILQHIRDEGLKTAFIEEIKKFIHKKKTNENLDIYKEFEFAPEELTLEWYISMVKKIKESKRAFSEPFVVEELAKEWDQADKQDVWDRMRLLYGFILDVSDDYFQIVINPEIEERVVRLLVGEWQILNWGYDPLYRKEDDKTGNYELLCKLYDKSLEEYGRVWRGEWAYHSSIECPGLDNEGDEEKNLCRFAFLTFNPRLFDYYCCEAWRREPYNILFLSSADPEKTLKLILYDFIHSKGDKSDDEIQALLKKRFHETYNIEKLVKILQVICKTSPELATQYRSEIIEFFDANKKQDCIPSLGLDNKTQDVENTDISQEKKDDK